MKQNQKLFISIVLGVVILLNVLVLGWLLSDFFSGPNGPEETVAATNGGEENTVGKTNTEKFTEEVTTEALPVEQIVKKIDVKDAKKLIHVFEWGKGTGKLGYEIKEDDIKYPDSFAVEKDIIYILDGVNGRILICEGSEYRQIDLGVLTQASGLAYQNGKIAVWGKSMEQDVLMLCREDGSTIMMVDIPDNVLRIGSIRRIIEMGETYVVFELLKDNRMEVAEYRFDWVDGKITYDPTEEPSFFEKDEETDVIGVFANEVFYSHSEHEKCTKVVSRESESYHLSTELDTAGYCFESKIGGYLSSDGRLFVMECFGEGVEISEIELNEKMAEASEEPTQEDESLPNETVSEWVEKSFAPEEIKNVVHTFSWGKEHGQLGYYSSEYFTFYPSTFTVEDDVIYIVDVANHRIVVYQQGAYTEIGYGDAGVVTPSSITYQNGWLAVLDKNLNTTFICRCDGSVSYVIENHPEYRLQLDKILEIGDTYVIFERYCNEKRMEVHYDWTRDEWSAGKIMANISDSASDESRTILGEYEENVYYYCWMEALSENPKCIIGRDAYNSRVYTIVDCAEHYILPSVALSSDGKLYIMEYFENRVEISELTLE